MPRYRRKKYARRYTKKNYRRRRRRRPARAKRATIPRTPFGNTKIVRHKYVTSQITLTSGLTTPATYVYRANGMYDPDHTGVGHQPFFYDQMSNIFHHWTVIGFRIKVTARQNANTTTCFAIMLDADSNAVADLTALNTRIEQGTCVKKLMNGANQATPTSITTLSYKCNPNKFLGVSNPMSSSIIRGSVAADPAELAYCKLVCAPLEAAAASISCFVEIEYIAVWSEPKNGNQS